MAISVNEKLTDNDEQGDNYLKISELHNIIKNYDSAIDSALEAIKYKQKEWGEYNTNVLDAYLTLSIIYINCDNYPFAQEYANKAESCIQDQNAPSKWLGKIYHQMGCIKMKMGYYLLSMEFYRLAYDNNKAVLVLDNSVQQWTDEVLMNSIRKIL